MTEGKQTIAGRPGPPDRPTTDAALTPAVERKVRLARLVLTWERLWPCLWPVVAVIAIFVCLSLFDIWSQLPGWLHTLVLAGFAFAVGWAAYRLAERFAPPDRRHAVRRVEQASELEHRPLSALEDSASAVPRPETGLLWLAYRRRLEATLGRLRVGLPSPGLVRHDPFGFRIVIGLALIVGFVVAGGDWQGRIGRAFAPNFASASVAIILEAWITPPGYTGAAPVFLTANGPVPGSDDSGSVIEIPAGSIFAARVHGGSQPPRAVIDAEEIAFEVADGENFVADIELRRGSRLAVTQGGVELGSWTVSILRDQPPTAGFASPPISTLRKALRVEFEADDDYGVTAAELRLWLADKDDDAAPSADDNEEVTVVTRKLPLPSGAPRHVGETGYYDLTDHPWAGLTVIAEIAATDASGQTGVSQPTFLRLPERHFTHPVARELVAIRKSLARDPENYAQARDRIDEVAQRPNRFNNDEAVFLGLRTAFWRLTEVPDAEAIAEVISLLWDIALRIEEGDMLLAERDLRRALEELEAALDAGAPAREIARLTDQVQDALNNYLRALAAKARDQNLQRADRPDARGQTLGADTFRDMLDQLRSLNQLGARDAARDLLSDMRNILENLRVGPSRAQSGQARAMTEALNNIDQLMRDQEELIDQTEDIAISRGGGLPEADARSRSRAMAGRQEALRQALSEALAGLGREGANPPGAAAEADRAMGDAREALEQGNLGTALQAESEALDALQKSAGQLARALAEATSGQAGGIGGSAIDPLGRSLNGGANPDQTGMVSREREIMRAREILEELQKRANQWRRPRAERDYIERLLKRF